MIPDHAGKRWVVSLAHPVDPRGQGLPCLLFVCLARGCHRHIFACMFLRLDVSGLACGSHNQAPWGNMVMQT